MNPINAQCGFVLHAKPYKETSLWLELFTPQSGRVAAIAKGAKRPKSPLRGLLQPFAPLLITLYGQHDLLTLTAAEMEGAPLKLSPKATMAGFYVNELLLKLLHRHDAHPALFEQYDQLIRALASNGALEPALRRFELKLLEDIGYGLDLKTDAEHQPIDPVASYRFIPKHGFLKVTGRTQDAIFSGSSLLAMADHHYSEESLREVKLLTRSAINALLGDVPLKTREIAGYFHF